MSTVQVAGKTGDEFIRIYEQVYVPVSVNSEGNVTLTLEPADTI